MEKNKKNVLNVEKVLAKYQNHAQRTSEMLKNTQKFLKGRREIKSYER